MTEGVPPRDPRAELAMRRLAAYGAATTPVISHEIGEDGSRNTFVDWPQPRVFDGDEQLARLVCLAGLPLDRCIDDLEPASRDPEVDAMLAASAARAERKRRREIIQQRRDEAEVHFAAVEAEVLARRRRQR